MASPSTSGSERAPRLRLAPLATLALLALAVACADGRPTSADTGPPIARVAVTATVPAQVAALTRTLVVTSGYVRGSAQPVAVPLDSSAVPVTVGAGVDVPVQINLTACLADPAREVPAFTNAGASGNAPACLLHLNLRLLDGSGAVVARAQALALASAGQTVVVGPVSF